MDFSGFWKQMVYQKTGQAGAEVAKRKVPIIWERDLPIEVLKMNQQQQRQQQQQQQRKVCNLFCSSLFLTTLLFMKHPLQSVMQSLGYETSPTPYYKVLLRTTTTKHYNMFCGAASIFVVLCSTLYTSIDYYRLSLTTYLIIQLSVKQL